MLVLNTIIVSVVRFAARHSRLTQAPTQETHKHHRRTTRFSPVTPRSNSIKPSSPKKRDSHSAQPIAHTTIHTITITITTATPSQFLASSSAPNPPARSPLPTSFFSCQYQITGSTSHRIGQGAKERNVHRSDVSQDPKRGVHWSSRWAALDESLVAPAGVAHVRVQQGVTGQLR
ncbi:hypothetical protein SVAN01_04097 [Stagonosporopsis vannaccii]|nr:hypothetical protein SVAN01_04097 [Stagonosporopsis vannaccii]